MPTLSLLSGSGTRCCSDAFASMERTIDRPASMAFA